MFDDDDFESGELGPSQALQLTGVETILINGQRQSPVVIAISKTTERDAKRDARVLATMFASALPRETIEILSELLFAEYLAPILQRREGMEDLLRKMYEIPSSKPGKGKTTKDADSDSD